MKIIPVREAVGTVLCHDITEIVPGKVKGRAFKKGHVVREEDIPRLLDLGKQHLYAWETGEGRLHENDASTRIARAVTGPGLALTEPDEGKVELMATVRGLLKIDVGRLDAVNGVDQICVATLHANQVVEPGQTVAGCRVVPLVIDAASVERVEALCAGAAPVVRVAPLRALRVGVVTTGSEVFHGRIQDRFGPVVRAKLEALGSRVTRQILAPDELPRIVAAIHEHLAEGAEMIVVTGGMSVDPDDLTPSAIRAAGGRVEVYGVPVLPGSMFMLAWIGAVPVLGLPGCVMYHRTTVADLILPRILAGEEVRRQDVARLEHGGLCLECQPCRHPNCSFGKGS
jgi:molybdenum cofactor synthesis domain-containing protein